MKMMTPKVISALLFTCLLSEQLSALIVPLHVARQHSALEPERHEMLREQALVPYIEFFLTPLPRRRSRTLQPEVSRAFGRRVPEPSHAAPVYHEMDEDYRARTISKVRAAIRALSDPLERERWGMLLQANYVVRQRIAVASRLIDHRFVPSEPGLRDWALLIWMLSAQGSLVEAWRTRQDEFRTICRTLIEDSLLHEAVHRELDDLSDDDRSRLGEAARKLGVTEDRIANRGAWHLIAQYVDDLGRTGPFRDLSPGYAGIARQLFEALPWEHPIRVLAAARVMGRTVHGFAEFDAAAMDAWIDRIVTAADRRIAGASTHAWAQRSMRIADHGPLQPVDAQHLPAHVQKVLSPLHATLQNPLSPDVKSDITVLPWRAGGHQWPVPIRGEQLFYYQMPEVGQDLLRYRRIDGAALGRSQVAVLTLPLTADGFPDPASPPAAWGLLYENQGHLWLLVGDRNGTLYQSLLPGPGGRRRDMGIVSAPAFEHLLLMGLHIQSTSHPLAAATYLLRRGVKNRSLKRPRFEEGITHTMAHSLFVLPKEHTRTAATRLVVRYAMPFYNRLALIAPDDVQSAADLARRPWVLFFENIQTGQLEVMDPQGRVDTIPLRQMRLKDRRAGNRYNRKIQPMRSENFRSLLDELDKLWVAREPSKSRISASVGGRLNAVLRIATDAEAIGVFRRMHAALREGPRSNQFLVLDTRGDRGSILEKTLMQLHRASEADRDAFLTLRQALLRPQGIVLTPEIRQRLEEEAMVRVRVPYGRGDQLEVVTEGRDVPVITLKTFIAKKHRKEEFGIDAGFNLPHILQLLARRRPGVVSERLVSFLMEPYWHRASLFYWVVRWKDAHRPWWVFPDSAAEKSGFEAARVNAPELDQAIAAIEYTGEWMRQFIPAEKRVPRGHRYVKKPRLMIARLVVARDAVVQWLINRNWVAGVLPVRILFAITAAVVEIIPSLIPWYFVWLHFEADQVFARRWQPWLIGANVLGSAFGFFLTPELFSYNPLWTAVWTGALANFLLHTVIDTHPELSPHYRIGTAA